MLVYVLRVSFNDERISLEVDAIDCADDGVARKTYVILRMVEI